LRRLPGGRPHRGKLHTPDATRYPCYADTVALHEAVDPDTASATETSTACRPGRPDPARHRPHFVAGAGLTRPGTGRTSWPGGYAAADQFGCPRDVALMRR